MEIQMVKAYERDMVIPTYEAAEPNRYPMFLDQRVYQGSSGRVYPYRVTEKISEEAVNHTWHVVVLENEYLEIWIMPELGGRVQRALDKTNGYDFVYYNRVIKPALVGLTGPWISGGIEFNWPQHHRPATYLPLDHMIRENDDGSVSVLCRDTDQMYGTEETHTFTLYPGKAYLEIKGRLYNGTGLPQTFLWWANPAVAVNNEYQSVFPPDVRYVTDHGRRDVSRFPIARGVYYKHDYSEGVDISCYRNIPVPTSFMADHSDCDFVGGYDGERKAGILHVANHRIAPGKKQWTWGAGDFGLAWEHQLTDEDGPYIELMTGVFTENQPDFSWLKPFEEKTFCQYFYPYKEAGIVQNANLRAAIRTELHGQSLTVRIYATEVIEKAMLTVSVNGKIVRAANLALSPENPYEGNFQIHTDDFTSILVQVTDPEGREIISYQEKAKEYAGAVQPAEPARLPSEIRTNEELLLTARHIEQNRHATWKPDPYYLEGLRRDPGDMRINLAYGKLLMKRGLLSEAESCFRTAVKRAVWRCPNPYDSECFYDLGLCLYRQGRDEEAYDAFYKAVWTAEQQEEAFYYLALLDAKKGNYEQALEHIDRALVRSWHSSRARGVRAVLLRLTGKQDLGFLYESLRIDPFDYICQYERYLVQYEEGERERLIELMRGSAVTILGVVRVYMAMGRYDTAFDFLSLYHGTDTMAEFYRAYLLDKLGRAGERDIVLTELKEAGIPDVFPNREEDIEVLTAVSAMLPDGGLAPYLLGCLWHDRGNIDEAIRWYEESIRRDASQADAHRALAIALYNGKKDEVRAEDEMRKAYYLRDGDARLLYELDLLNARLGKRPEERLMLLSPCEDVVLQRDDLTLSYVTLLNTVGDHDKALSVILGHNFHPWEGAEGKISAQYKLAAVSLAITSICARKGARARVLLDMAAKLPANLGEARLEGTKDSEVHFFMGVVREQRGMAGPAADDFRRATEGADEPGAMQYYYDQPADQILIHGLAHRKLGETAAAASCFSKLLDYGERHLGEEVKDDFFAVSLPEFGVFDDDPQRRHKAHCHYVLGLAALGRGDRKEAVKELNEARRIDPCHQMAAVYLRMEHKNAALHIFPEQEC